MSQNQKLKQLALSGDLPHTWQGLHFLSRQLFNALRLLYSGINTKLFPNTN